MRHVSSLHRNVSVDKEIRFRMHVPAGTEKTASRR